MALGARGCAARGCLFGSGREEDARRCWSLGGTARLEHLIELGRVPARRCIVCVACCGCLRRGVVVVHSSLVDPPSNAHQDRQRQQELKHPLEHRPIHRLRSGSRGVVAAPSSLPSSVVVDRGLPDGRVVVRAHRRQRFVGFGCSVLPRAVDSKQTPTTRSRRELVLYTNQSARRLGRVLRVRRIRVRPGQRPE